ncbi:MAG: fasciclin domain-containing protein [Pseudomonadota bacterium]
MSGFGDDDRPFDADGPDTGAQYDRLDDDPMSSEDSLFLAPRLKFKAGGSLSLDGENPEQSTFEPSEAVPRQRADELPDVLEPAFSETLHPVPDEAEAFSFPISGVVADEDSVLENELGVAGLEDEAGVANTIADVDDITFAPLEVNDVTTTPSAKFPSVRPINTPTEDLASYRDVDEERPVSGVRSNTPSSITDGALAGRVQRIVAASESGATIKGADDVRVATNSADGEDITFEPVEAHDIATTSPGDVRPIQPLKTTTEGLARYREVDGDSLGAAIPSAVPLPVTYGTPARRTQPIMGSAQSLGVLVRDRALGVGRAIVSTSRSVVSSVHRLMIFGQAKAVRGGHVCGQLYQGLHVKASQSWPHVASAAQRAGLSVASSLTAGAQAAAEKMSLYLGQSVQWLSVVIHKIGRRTKLSIADLGPNLAKRSGGGVTGGLNGALLRLPLSRLAVGLPSLASSGLGRGVALPGFKPVPRMAVVGLAAVSIVIGVLLAAQTQFTPSASASLTFPLPERPGSDSQAIANAKLDESADAIENIIDYVAGQTPASERELLANGHSIIETVAAMDGFDEFVRAAKTVDLDQILAPGETYTIFLPSDEAFAKLGRDEVEDLLDPTGHERLLTLLSHHIIPERVTLNTLKSGSRPHVSLAGRELTIDGGGEAIRIGDIHIVDTGPEVENNIFHVINRVLTYPEL